MKHFKNQNIILLKWLKKLNKYKKLINKFENLIKTNAINKILKKSSTKNKATVIMIIKIHIKANIIILIT